MHDRANLPKNEQFPTTLIWGIEIFHIRDKLFAAYWKSVIEPKIVPNIGKLFFRRFYAKNWLGSLF